MQTYKNLSNNSGVTFYEIGSDYIAVKFNYTNNLTYLYNYNITGIQNVEHMKLLAIIGEGLNTFIAKNVGKKYARKY